MPYGVAEPAVGVAAVPLHVMVCCCFFHFIYYFDTGSLDCRPKLRYKVPFFLQGATCKVERKGDPYEESNKFSSL